MTSWGYALTSVTWPVRLPLPTSLLAPNTKQPTLSFWTYTGLRTFTEFHMQNTSWACSTPVIIVCPIHLLCVCQFGHFFFFFGVSCCVIIANFYSKGVIAGRTTWCCCQFRYRYISDFTMASYAQLIVLILSPGRMQAWMRSFVSLFI